MANPGLTINVLDGNLNLQPGGNTQLMLYLGACTLGLPNTLYTYSDSTTMLQNFDAGKLVEGGGFGMTYAGGPTMFMPVATSTRGGVGAVTKTGTGAGTVAVSIAPHRSVSILCTTAGTIGTAAFTFTLGATATLPAVTSAPVTSVAGWTSTGYTLPGTYVNIVFVAGSYVAGGTPDIYTISTLGAVAHPQGAGPVVPTFTASPVDDYNVLVTIPTAGALGVAQFIYSLDNGASQLKGAGTNSSAVLVPAGGVYAIPYTGLVLTFASTFTMDNTYTFQTAGPSSSPADMTAAYTALQTTFLNQAIYSMVTVLNTYASVAAWATAAAAAEAFNTTMNNLGVYVRVINEVPTLGTVSGNAGSITVDVADTDSVVVTARQGVSAPHVNGGAGDMLLYQPLSGLNLRRSAAFTTAMRSSKFEASRNIGDVSAGGVPGVIYLFRNEYSTQALDAAGLTTMSQYPGVAGFYMTDAHTCTLATSDYYPWTNARVVDRASQVCRLNGMQLVNTKQPTTTRSGQPGCITEKAAAKIEKKINSALATALVDSNPQDAVATNVIVTRTNNLLSSGNLIITGVVQPYGYARTISFNVGLTVQV